MKTKLSAVLWAAALFLSSLAPAHGAGVTIITHGADGNGAGWITPMMQQLAFYPSYPGSNYSYYQINVEIDFFHNLTTSIQKRGGDSPLVTDSGEIIMVIDWSAPGYDPFFSTADIAQKVVPTLLSTESFPELGGRSVVEFPIHLIGHSRGGSLVSKISELLGYQGVWVDQVTTLDPHPVSEVGDPDAEIYANVLFADNYWQLSGATECPSGNPVTGAYNRRLTDLQNGEACNHGDVHLWYHGTIDWLHTPITVDGVTLTANERATWWTVDEAQGRDAGFRYSLMGGGNRLSTNQPAGAGNGQIRDGLNQRWDFGAGTVSNRRPLAANNRTWPSLIKFDYLSPTTVVQGDTVSLRYYFQFGLPVTGSAIVEVRLDGDANPYNGDLGKLYEATEVGTGSDEVGQRQFTFTTTNTAPGQYYLYAKITEGTHVRYLPAAGKLTVTTVSTLGIVQSGTNVVVTWSTNAMGFVLERTPALLTTWSTVATAPVIVNGQNTVTNPVGTNEFFRLKK